MFLDLPELAGKQLQFLQENLGRIKRDAGLWQRSASRTQFESSEAAARAAGIALVSLSVERSEDLDAAVAQAGRERVSALSVLTSPIIFANRTRIASLSLKH